MKTRPTLINRSWPKFVQAWGHWISRERVLVEGDSWFQYTALFILSVFDWFRPSNLYLSIHARLPMVTLTMSCNGDTTERMMSEGNLRKMERHLRNGDFEFLLFSGGGNDIVNALGRIVRPHTEGLCTIRCVNKLALDAELSQIRERYEQLVAMRDRVSPSTRILVHNYGVPNLRKGGFRKLGVTLAGPWIQPKLKALGYTDVAQMTGIIAHLMRHFDGMLREVEGLEVMNTAALLTPDCWRDEMHLTPEGYDRAAMAFVDHLNKPDNHRGQGYP